jgi:uncharacterized protein (TIGR00369 family)
VPRDMSKWLGNGGMPLLDELGASIRDYRVGHAEGEWKPTSLCCNPQGFVQAGTFTVVLDALMNFAVLASLDPGETTATLEIKTSNLRPALEGHTLKCEGKVERLGSTVAFTTGAVFDDAGRVVAQATGTFFLRRNRKSERA